MELLFRTVTGKIYTINIQPNQTLTDAKQILQAKEGFDTSQCRFIYGAAILNENRPVSEFKITPKNYIAIYSPTRPKCNLPPPKIDPVQTHSEATVIPQNLQISPAPDSPVVVLPSPQPSRPPSSPSGTSDPPNFEELVQQLVEMGFQADQCRQALRMRRYNLDSATDCLLSGEISGPAEPLSPPAPVPAPPEPQRYSGKYGELQGVFDQLTDEEKAAVSRLEQLGMDSSTVLQIYMACEKDEERTSSCIRDMMN